MVVQTNPNLKNISQDKLIILCTILSLNTRNPLFQITAETNKPLSLNIRFQSIDLVVSQFLDLGSHLLVQEIAFKLLCALNNRFTISGDSLQYQEYEEVKQYLRKFTFFYCYYYINNYPNDISLLSIKKINQLAIKGLFIINSL